MTKLRPTDDWPKVSFHKELARGSEPLRAWVSASPRRALSADGMTLFVGRRRGVYRMPDGSIHLRSDPPDRAGEGMFVVDVFHADADGTGYSQSQALAPNVEILRLACEAGALRAVLRLTEEPSMNASISACGSPAFLW